jgi:hypothetical protein
MTVACCQRVVGSGDSECKMSQSASASCRYDGDGVGVDLMRKGLPVGTATGQRGEGLVQGADGNIV